MMNQDKTCPKCGRAMRSTNKHKCCDYCRRGKGEKIISTSAFVLVLAAVGKKVFDQIKKAIENKANEQIVLYVFVLRRVEKLESGLLIKPLNPNYETLFFTPQQCIDLPVEVKGVFWELRRSKIRKK